MPRSSLPTCTNEYSESWKMEMRGMGAVSVKVTPTSTSLAVACRLGSVFALAGQIWYVSV